MTKRNLRLKKTEKEQFLESNWLPVFNYLSYLFDIKDRVMYSKSGGEYKSPFEVKFMVFSGGTSRLETRSQR